MNEVDKAYIKLINDVFENGVDKKDRTGVGTKAVFGRSVRFNVSKNAFPIVTLKKIHFKSVLHELLWFLSGETNIEYLQEHNVNIWNEWADEDGELGPVYGKQWRKWPKYYTASSPSIGFYSKTGVDQINNLIKGLKEKPESRRHMVSAWNVSDLEDMALHPCHYGFQCNSRPSEEGDKRVLDILVNQRSADVGLGWPFNISSYSLLLLMLSQITNHVPGEIIWNGGDIHIYNSHKEQIKKVCEMPSFELPSVKINEEVDHIDDFTHHDFELKGYNHGPYIKMPIAV